RPSARNSKLGTRNWRRAMRCEELRGKVAVVTGASRGIGKGIAARFAAEGLVLAVPTDVGEPEQVERLFAETVRVFGPPDVLVNNAAWATPIAHILEMDLEHWDTVIQSNLRSIYLCCHRAANLMVDHGIRGSIVNISSFAAVRSHRYMAAYDASKG